MKKNISDKIYMENQNIHFMLNNLFSENLAVYEIMWKIMVKFDRSQMTILKCGAGEGWRRSVGPIM